MQALHALPRYHRAIAGLSDLLGRLRLEFIFAGNVARAVWLGSPVENGPLDAIVLMKPEQKNNVATMAGNRGFRVDRDEVEQTAELDLIPLNFLDPDGEVRIHVLVASNALYGRMVAAGVPAGAFRVARAEDLALMFALGEGEESRRTSEMLARLPEFDRAAYNRHVVSIGVPQLAIAE